MGSRISRSYDSIRLFIYLFIDESGFWAWTDKHIERHAFVFCVCRDDSDWTRFTDIRGGGGGDS